MTIVVPDASVILKWALQRPDEADSALALALLEAFVHEKIEIRIPSLWRYEVGNILARKQPATAVEAMEALLGCEFPEEPLHHDYCLAVLRFMHDLKHVSFYDASYHVLAWRVNGLYITADREYVRIARSKGSIILLSEWSPPVPPGR